MTFSLMYIVAYSDERLVFVFLSTKLRECFWKHLSAKLTISRINLKCIKEMLKLIWTLYFYNGFLFLSTVSKSSIFGPKSQRIKILHN